MVRPAWVSARPSDTASGNAASSAGSRSSASKPRVRTPVIARPAAPPNSEKRSGPAASPVVGELQGNVEIQVAQLLDHRLQLVLVLARDPQLIALGPDLR